MSMTVTLDDQGKQGVSSGNVQKAHAAGGRSRSFFRLSPKVSCGKVASNHRTQGYRPFDLCVCGPWLYELAGLSLFCDN